MVQLMLPFALLFGLSIAVGAWLSRRFRRGPWRSTWPLPAFTGFLTMAALIMLVLGSGPHDEFLDLGLLVTTMVGVCATLLAWAGAMAGALWLGQK